MSENILGMPTQAELLDLGFSIERPTDPFEPLFGDERSSNLYARWQSIASEYQIPLAASFHAFDTESLKTFRVPVDNHMIEKGLIKVKLNQSERMRELLKSGVQQSELYDYILRDGARLVDQVVTRSKVARAEVMATGKMTIKENNLDLFVDYNVPSDQLNLTLNFGTDDDIAGQLQDLLDKASDKGVTLTGFVTSRANLTKMRQNKSLQGLINGAYMQGAQLTTQSLNNFLEQEYGLSTIITNDLNYAVPDGFDEVTGRPKVLQKRYFPKDKISFFAANPSGRVGVSLWGDPPEVDLQGVESATTGESPYVYVTQKQEWDPAVLWTKASAVYMPVLYNPNSLWIAKTTGE